MIKIKKVVLLTAKRLNNTTFLAYIWIFQFEGWGAIPPNPIDSCFAPIWDAAQ